MSLLDPRVWLAVTLALMMSYGAGRLQQHHIDAKAFQAERTAAALAATQTQLKAVNEARAEEQRRTEEQSRIADEARKDSDTARADANAAHAVAERLRQRLGELVAAGHAAGNSATAGPSQAAGDPLDVLADVLSRADKRAGELAEYADAAHVAGQACERAYDALSPGG